jgi:hypothetical protein
MSVSSAVSSFLFCCFHPTGAYYSSSHTLYYRDREGGLAGGGLRMGRRSNKPLALQVRPAICALFLLARAVLCM